MFTQIVAINTAGIDLKMLANSPLHPSCIQKGSRPNHALLGKTCVVLIETGHHIDWIGNDQQDPIKTNPYQFLGYLRNLGRSKGKFCKTVCIWIVLEGNVSQGRNDHIRICQGLIIIEDNIGMVKSVHGRVLKINRIRLQLSLIKVNQDIIIKCPLHHQSMSHRRAHMAHSNNSNFSCHFKPPCPSFLILYNVDGKNNSQNLLKISILLKICPKMRRISVIF